MKKGVVKRFLCLFHLLRTGQKEVKDEYHAIQVQKIRYRLSAVSCLLLIAFFLYFLLKPDMNRTQFASLVSMVLALLPAGAGLAGCIKGTLPASDPFGGRLSWWLGCGAVALHCSFVIPTRYYFGNTLFFWDLALLGIIVYYVLCNEGWVGWLHFQSCLDEANDPNDEAKAGKRWKLKNGVLFFCLGLILALPSLLGFSVYSDTAIENAMETAEKEQEELKTPEYREYAALIEKWEEPETYAILYALPLSPAFFESEPSYKKGAALKLHGEDKEIVILFDMTEKGVRLIQSTYEDFSIEDTAQSHFQYLEGNWYSEEESILLHQQGTPGFEAEKLTPYDLRIYGSLSSHPESLERIEKTDENGLQRLTYIYSVDYLKQIRESIEKMGVPESEPVTVYESLLVDENQMPVEFSYYNETMKTRVVNARKQEEPEIIQYRCRYLNLDADGVEGIIQKSIKEEPFVPDEALKLYGMFYE